MNYKKDPQKKHHPRTVSKKFSSGPEKGIKESDCARNPWGLD